MGKLVVLKIGDGNFSSGFSVTLQIGEEIDSPAGRLAWHRPSVELVGSLPPAPQLPIAYQDWQLAYRQLSSQGMAPRWNVRLGAPSHQITNVSFQESCHRAAHDLRQSLNDWLRAESFRAIREGLLENLKGSDVIRVIVQADLFQLKQLPWHLWEVFERYPYLEIALGTPNYRRVKPVPPLHSRIKILAILGSSDGINLKADQALLKQLPGADVTFLVKPRLEQLNEQLWKQGWDILFFAGHSSSDADGSSGRMELNSTEGLTVYQLMYGLRRAVQNGLKLVILNSCDGLGIAKDLAGLNIPQSIVMKEPVPDRVAAEFLKSFLNAFSRGEPFYLAVREAREKLQGLEDQFPCATWLPMICQNPAELPPRWTDWYSSPAVSPEVPPAVYATPAPSYAAIGSDADSRASVSSPRNRSPQKTANQSRSRSGVVMQPTTPTSTTALRRLQHQKKRERWNRSAILLYHHFTEWVQVGVIMAQAMLWGGLGSLLGAGLGLWLVCRSPFMYVLHSLFSQSVSLSPQITLAVEPALIWFGLAGIGTLLGLRYTSMGHHRSRWNPYLMGCLSYVLGWLVYKMVGLDAVPGSLMVVGAIASSAMILNLSLVYHPLLGGLTAIFVSPIFFKGVLASSWTAALAQSVLEGTCYQSPLWPSMVFFGILGVLPGFCLTVSHYILVPRLGLDPR